MCFEMVVCLYKSFVCEFNGEAIYDYQGLINRSKQLENEGFISIKRNVFLFVIDG